MKLLKFYDVVVLELDTKEQQNTLKKYIRVRIRKRSIQQILVEDGYTPNRLIKTSKYKHGRLLLNVKFINYVILDNQSKCHIQKT